VPTEADIAEREAEAADAAELDRQQLARLRRSLRLALDTGDAKGVQIYQERIASLSSALI
jgi:hypothetical protein